MPDAKIVTIANFRRGVGKTTTVMNLAAAKAKQGKMVLMIDLDPQYCLTESCAIYPDELQGGSSCDLFSNKASLLKCCYYVEANRIRNFFILPAIQELALLGSKFFIKKSHVSFFKENIDLLSNIFDYIFIDTSSQYNDLLLSALLCSNEVIIPVKPECLSYKGLDFFREAIISDCHHEISSKLKSADVLVNKYQKNTKEHDTYIKKIKAEESVLGVIPDATIVTKELKYGRPVTIAHPTSTVAKTFTEIANKI